MYSLRYLSIINLEQFDPCLFEYNNVIPFLESTKNFIETKSYSRDNIFHALTAADVLST